MITTKSSAAFSALLLGIAAAVWYGIAAPRIELAELARDSATALADVRAEQLRTQQQHADQLAAVRADLAAVQQIITTSAAGQRQQLERLRNESATVRDWLSAAVPADLGRLYARPGGTDPGAYRQPPAVPADPVLPAGKASADDGRGTADGSR